MTGSAELSSCGTFRYRLQRTWNPDAPLIVFLMLNPSTADATSDDATLRACLRRALAGGFGRLTVLNLFALRATDPARLQQAADPVGPGNEAALRDGLSDLKADDRLICAWPGSWSPQGANDFQSRLTERSTTSYSPPNTSAVRASVARILGFSRSRIGRISCRRRLRV